MDSIQPSALKPDFNEENRIIQQVLDAAFRVHTELGPGLLEGVYEGALFHELLAVGLNVQRQVPVPVVYKGHNLGVGFRADLIIEEWLLLELKTVNEFVDEHVSQILTYMKLLNLKRGYLMNFSKKRLKDGLKRISR